MIRRPDTLRRRGFRAIERRRGVPDTGQKQEAHPSCFLHCVRARTVAGPVSLPSRLRNRNERYRPAERECQSQESVLSCGKRTNRGNTSYVAVAGTTQRAEEGKSGLTGDAGSFASVRRQQGPATRGCQPLSVPPFRAPQAQQLRAIPTTRLPRAGGMDRRPVRDAHTTASHRSPRADCRARSARRRDRNTR